MPVGIAAFCRYGLAPLLDKILQRVPAPFGVRPPAAMHTFLQLIDKMRIQLAYELELRLRLVHIQDQRHELGVTNPPGTGPVGGPERTAEVTALPVGIGIADGMWIGPFGRGCHRYLLDSIGLSILARWTPLVMPSSPGL